MSASLNDALDVRVIAHATGLDEVLRCAKNARLALDQLDAAIENIKIELEVDE